MEESLINRKPFTWSEANPEWQELKEKSCKDFIPDKLDVEWNETNLFMD